MAGYGGGGFDTNQFGGGGFGPTQADNGYGQTQKQGGGSKMTQTLRAVTAHQLLNCTATPDDSFLVDGVAIQNVTLLGKIVNVEPGNEIRITLHDGTGAIEVQLFNNNMGLLETLAPSRYARAFGQWRSYGGKSSLNAYSVRLVDDANEITHHGLQVIFEHLHLLQGAQGSGQDAPAPAAMAFAGSGYSGPAGGGGLGAPAGNVPAQPYAGGAAGPAAAGPMYEVVFSLMERLGSGWPNGMHLDQIRQELGGSATAAQVKEAMDVLQNDGRVYSTADDLHWKVC